jgi:hypothetical protein
METACFSETFVLTYKCTRPQTPRHYQHGQSRFRNRKKNPSSLWSYLRFMKCNLRWIKYNVARVDSCGRICEGTPVFFAPKYRWVVISGVRYPAWASIFHFSVTSKPALTTIQLYVRLVSQALSPTVNKSLRICSWPHIFVWCRRLECMKFTSASQTYWNRRAYILVQDYICAFTFHTN